MKQRGFSLIELLIVVAMILIIAAIGVPKYISSRMAANESSAVGSLHAVNTAQALYQQTFPGEGYAPTLSALGPSSDGTITLQNAGLLDNVLGCSSQPCFKSGYNISISHVVALGSQVAGYTVTGVPATVGSTGMRGFCSGVEGGVLSPITYDPAGGTNCTLELQ